MNNPKKEDIDQQGGWLFLLKTPPNLTRLFYVYELDEESAQALLKKFAAASDSEMITTISKANIHALTGIGMKPAGVKQYA
jgi:hypothetical protein